MNVAIILSTTGLFLNILSIIIFYKSKKIRIEKHKQQQQYELELSQKIILSTSELNLLSKQIGEQKFALQQLNKSIIQTKNKQNDELEEYRTKIKFKKGQLDKQYEEYNQHKIKEITESYSQLAEEAHQKYKIQINEIRKEKNELTKQIENYQNTLAAAIEDQARERQKKEKLNFYKLPLTNEELADVRMLQNLKPSFHQPIVLSKLIWTQFFQKKMTDLCNRVLNGRKNVCGIYKITDLITKQYYIGQSKAIDDRWKTHCKYGLGIDTPTTNILYKAMQKDGVWNFTFQLLEECKLEELNEKQAFWIETYKSNIYGLNTQAGNKKKG